MPPEPPEGNEQIHPSEGLQKAPLVSVVIVTYFTGPWLEACLASLLSQDMTLELIVVDNGNPPDVTANLGKIAQKNPAFHVLTGHGNIGFAGACNKGARQACGSILFFLNPDCELPPGAVRQLMEEGARHTGRWMVGAHLVNDDGSEQRGARRGVLTPLSALVEGLRLYRVMPGRTRRVRFHLHTQSLPSGPVRVPVISGACMMLPAAAYWDLRGMDENYFLHVEDVDFCLRFNRQGGEVYFVPSVTIRHHQGTSAASPLLVEWHKMKGFLRYFWKNFRSDSSLLLLIAVSCSVLALFLGRALLAPFRR